MKASDLRIGNFTDKGEVKNFWERGVHVGFGKCYEFNELKPIPITEEWLLKFGFKKNEIYSSLYVNLGLELMNINNKYYRAFYRKVAIKPDMIYAHQLQNLYFALTGEELKLKDHE